MTGQTQTWTIDVLSLLQTHQSLVKMIMPNWTHSNLFLNDYFKYWLGEKPDSSVTNPWLLEGSCAVKQLHFQPDGHAPVK